MSGGDQSNSEFTTKGLPPIGKEWGEFDPPAGRAVIATIDNDELHQGKAMVGLSAKQQQNLRIAGPIEKNKNDAAALLEMVKQNKAGLPDSRQFGKVIVEFSDRNVVADTYNAFGERSTGGGGIRISAELAKSLGVKVGDYVAIRKFIEEKLKE